MQSHFAAGVGFFTAYITFAHLFGGVFLVIGLFTRLVAHSFRRHFLYYTSAKNSRFRVGLYSFGTGAWVDYLCVGAGPGRDFDGSLPEGPFVVER